MWNMERLFVSCSLVWVRERNLCKGNPRFCLCRKGIKCLSFWIKKWSNIGPGAGLGPTKVGKVRDTYGRLRNKVVFSFESEARRCHHARTKSLLILRIERGIRRFAGFLAVQQPNHFRSSWRCIKITASFLVPWVPYRPPNRFNLGTFRRPFF